MRLSVLVAMTAVVSCGASVASVDVDCGSTAEQPFITYDATGRDCVWDAYTRGRTVKWVATWRTMEGDPITRTLFVTSKEIQASLDNREDKHGGPDRGVVTWRCSTIAKHPISVGDGSRYDFYLSGCTGPNASTTFP